MLIQILSSRETLLKHCLQLIDICLLLDDGSCFSAHKLVLACHSPFFRKLLIGGFRETGTATVSLCEVNAFSVSSMLKFLYYGRVVVSDLDAAIALGRLADLYELPALRAAVFDAVHAVAAVSPANALAALSATRAAGLVDLEVDLWEIQCEMFPVILAAAAAANASGIGCSAARETGAEGVLLAMPEAMVVEYLSMVRKAFVRQNRRAHLP